MQSTSCGDKSSIRWRGEATWWCPWRVAFSWMCVCPHGCVQHARGGKEIPWAIVSVSVCVLSCMKRRAKPWAPERVGTKGKDEGRQRRASRVPDEPSLPRVHWGPDALLVPPNNPPPRSGYLSSRRPWAQNKYPELITIYSPLMKFHQSHHGIEVHFKQGEDREGGARQFHPARRWKITTPSPSMKINNEFNMLCRSFHERNNLACERRRFHWLYILRGGRKVEWAKEELEGVVGPFGLKCMF